MKDLLFFVVEENFYDRTVFMKSNNKFQLNEPLMYSTNDSMDYCVDLFGVLNISYMIQ